MSQARKNRKFWLMGLVLAAAGFGVALYKVFNENLVFFYTPEQLMAGDTPKGLKSYRLGGMVEKGSVQRSPDSLQVSFNVTDSTNTVRVEFNGILPDLFKEGTGVVAEGNWDGQTFKATEVLAKHDENYMPPGVKP